MGNSPASLRRRFRGNKSPESSSKLTKGKKRRSGLAGSFKDTTVPMESPPRATDGRFRPEASASEGVNEQAVAVAAATAAVAEAALAAAHAAAAVVRLTGGNPSTPAHVSVGGRRTEELAAVKIQSAFRAYLARRALRALKGLVKLQALVRGHFVRRQTADILRRMNALARVQARARANRAHHPLSDSPLSTSNSFARHASIGFPTPDRSMHKLGFPILKRCASNSKTRNATPQTKPHLVPNWPDQWIETHNSWNNPANDEKSDKILEVDTGVMPVHFTRSTRTFQAPAPSMHSREEPALYWDNVLKPCVENGDDGSTPQVFSASSRFNGRMRRGALTPGRSERLRGFSNGYMDHPNYMANTESSRAKVRAQSAPRQRRIEFDHPQGSISRRDVHGLWDAGAYSSRGWDSRSIDYTISGRFDRFDDRLLSPSLR